MSPAQFEKLLENMDGIVEDFREFREQRIGEFKYDIGDGLHVTASDGFPCIHMRFYFQNAEMAFALPTKCGIALCFDEFEALINVLDQIKDRVQKLDCKKSAKKLNDKKCFEIDMRGILKSDNEAESGNEVE